MNRIKLFISNIVNNLKATLYRFPMTLIFLVSISTIMYIIIEDFQNINEDLLSIEAGKLLLKFVFEEMPIHRFYSYILDGHTASIAMVEKLGFKTEGMMKECVYKLNKFHDAVCIYILKDDYQILYHGEVNHEII